jgi:hypothetical protein
MDPIHPIRPKPAIPAAVDPVRRVLRTGEDRSRQDERPASGRQRKAPAAAAQAVVTPDGHLDTRA